MKRSQFLYHIYFQMKLHMEYSFKFKYLIPWNAQDIPSCYLYNLCLQICLGLGIHQSLLYYKLVLYTQLHLFPLLAASISLNYKQTNSAQLAKHSVLWFLHFFSQCWRQQFNSLRLQNHATGVNCQTCIAAALDLHNNNPKNLPDR